MIVLLGAAPALAQSPLRLTLDEAVERALANSHRLAEASAREVGARRAVLARKLADHPTVSAGAGYSRTNHVEEFGFLQPDGRLRVIFPDIPDNLFTRLSLAWPIYSGGRTDALERAAEAEARAFGADLAATRSDLRLEVVRTYWALVTAGATVEVVDQAVGRAEAHLADVRARFEAGVVPPNEVASAEALRSRQQLQLLEATNLRRSVLEELRRLTGVTAEIEPADALGAPPLLAPDAAADPHQRAEHQSIADRLRAAEARRLAVEAGRRPTIAVTGTVDYANPNPRIFPRRDVWRDSWDVTVVASWTVWDGGRVAAEAAEVAATEAALRARLAEVDSLISLEVAQRRLDRDYARAALTTAADGIRSAAEARRVVGERYAAGVATSTEVLDAQVALLQAELDRTRALANIRLAEARLDRALGR
ncbi:MAG: TolC family protein [Acidobacteriota bacterium]